MVATLIAPPFVGFARVSRNTNPMAIYLATDLEIVVSILKRTSGMRN
jgi:hypothetical protein